MIYRLAPFLMTLTTPNLDFKVMPIFDAEYLSNSKDRDIQQLVCNLLIEWCHFQWLWVAPDPDFKGMPGGNSTFNIANTVLYVITIKTKKPSMLTGHNVRLSNLLISSCYYCRVPLTVNQLIFNIIMIHICKYLRSFTRWKFPTAFTSRQIGIHLLISKWLYNFNPS